MLSISLHNVTNVDAVMAGQAAKLHTLPAAVFDIELTDGNMTKCTHVSSFSHDDEPLHVVNLVFAAVADALTDTQQQRSQLDYIYGGFEPRNRVFWTNVSAVDIVCGFSDLVLQYLHLLDPTDFPNDKFIGLARFLSPVDSSVRGSRYSV